MAKLNRTKRDQLDALLRSPTNYTQEQLASIIHCDQSTISREIKRSLQGNRKQYNANTAQKRSDERTQEVYDNRPHWYDNNELYVEVIFELYDRKSPDQIAGRMKEQGWSVTISTRAIYDYIEQDKSNGGKLYKLLRYQGKKYKFRGCKKNTARIPNRKGIEERPIAVELKEEVGHWETDLVVSGQSGSGAVATFAERKYIYFKAILVEDQSANEMLRATKEALKDLPAALRQTMTHDNGKEICSHEKITEELNIDVYCARPYHSWERGLNEWCNRELRRFFPKGTDFSKITQREIDFAVDWLNNCPRRSLGYRTPKECFEEELEIMRFTL